MPHPKQAHEGPVGQGDYLVKTGDCLSSIADAAGHFWQYLWNLPENAELQRVRGNPNVLMPGDRLTIPPVRPKTETAITGRRHAFRRRGIPYYLRVRLLCGEAPRAFEPFRVEVAGKVLSGTTDGDGRLVITLPSGAREGTIVLGEGAREERFPFRLGTMEPATVVRGVQSRLANLGYDCVVTGTLDARTSAALAAFQQARSLTPTGEPDAETRSALVETHGC